MTGALARRSERGLWCLADLRANPGSPTYGLSDLDIRLISLSLSFVARNLVGGSINDTYLFSCSCKGHVSNTVPVESVVKPAFSFRAWVLRARDQCRWDVPAAGTPTLTFPRLLSSIMVWVSLTLPRLAVRSVCLEPLAFPGPLLGALPAPALRPPTSPMSSVASCCLRLLHYPGSALAWPFLLVGGGNVSSDGREAEVCGTGGAPGAAGTLQGALGAPQPRVRPGRVHQGVANSPARAGGERLGSLIRPLAWAVAVGDQPQTTPARFR